MAEALGGTRTAWGHANGRPQPREREGSAGGCWLNWNEARQPPRSPCPGDSDPVGRRGKLRHAVLSSPAAAGTEPGRSRAGWTPPWSWQRTPGGWQGPPVSPCSQANPTFWSKIWGYSLCNRREVLGGEVCQPGDPGDPAGLGARMSLPTPCSTHSPSSPQVPPPVGGDADQKLQRAGSLLLPAAYLPAPAAA